MQTDLLLDSQLSSIDIFLYFLPIPDDYFLFFQYIFLSGGVSPSPNITFLFWVFLHIYYSKLKLETIKYIMINILIGIAVNF